MKKSILFITTLTLLFSSCKKDQTTFSGISMTDANGTPIGTPDTDDWNLNDNWNSQEQGLFGGSNSLCSSSSSIQIEAFPNPNNGIFSVYAIGIDSTQTISFRVVNQNFEVLASRDNSSSGNNIFNVNTPNQIVRVYYKISGNGCEYKGHGDVQIQ